MKFHPIHIDPASGIRLPERMNNPFCYEPHPLCIMACKELQEKIAQRDDWREEIDRGKMFGVLIVVLLVKPDGLLGKHVSEKV